MMVKIIFTCDLWKLRGSMRLKGVFTNQDKFLTAIRKLVKEKEIELDNGKITELKEWSVGEINDNFKYLYVEEVELNELQ